MVSGTLASPLPVVRGRNRELARIEVVLQDARPVLVRGAAGVGVTTLLAETLRRVRLHDVEVGVVRTPAWSSPAEVVAAVRATTHAPGRSLVVLDDAHRVHEGLVGALVDATRPTRTGLLVGAHDDVYALSEDPLASVVDLPALDRAATADVVSASLGERVDPGGPLASAYHRASAGNPATLRALLDVPRLRAVLDEARDVDDPTLLAGRLGSAISAWLMDLLAGLGVEVAEAVAVTALAGDQAPPAVVRAAAGARGLDEATGVGLLAPDGAGGVVFRHGAVRRRLLDLLSPEAVVELRGRLSAAARVHGLGTDGLPIPALRTA